MDRPSSGTDERLPVYYVGVEAPHPTLQTDPAALDSEGQCEVVGAVVMLQPTASEERAIALWLLHCGCHDASRR